MTRPPRPAWLRAADKICLLLVIVLGVISLVQLDERALWTLPLIPMLVLDIGYWLWCRRAGAWTSADPDAP